MPRRANTQTQQEAVQENAAVQADAGADMQMEAAITKTQPEKGVLALADVKIGDFMTIRNVRIKEDDYGLTVAMPKTKAGDIEIGGEENHETVKKPYCSWGTLHCSVPAHLFCSNTACQCRTVPKDHNRAFCKGR